MKMLGTMLRNVTRLALVLVGVVGAWTDTQADEALQTPKYTHSKEKVTSGLKTMNKTFPALRLIPQGQPLKNVSVIQYDKYRKTGLLTADTMTVLSETVIAGNNVTVYLYDDLGGQQTEMKMKEAQLIDNSVLKTSQKTTIKDVRFETEGTSLTFDSATNVGWMTGPIKSRIHVKPLNKPE
jgi:lipopolysaccharide export system protein LptC